MKPLMCPACEATHKEKEQLGSPWGLEVTKVAKQSFNLSGLPPKKRKLKLDRTEEIL